MNTNKNNTSLWQKLKKNLFNGDWKIDYKIGDLFGYLQTTPYPKDKIKRENLKDRLKELKAESKLVNSIKDDVEKQNKQEELLSKLAHLKGDLEQEMKSEG
jgi:actin-related protein